TVLVAALPTFGLILPARFISGLPHGTYYAVTALLAADILGPGNRAKGIAIALNGLMIANIFGASTATWVGQNYGWRVSYWLLSAIFVVTALLFLLTMPKYAKPARDRRVRDELVIFKSWRIWMIMIIECIGFAAFFAIYTSTARLSTEYAKFNKTALPLIFMAIGIGMLLATWITGFVVDKFTYRRAIKYALVAQVVAFVALLGTMLISGAESGGLRGALFIVIVATAILIGNSLSMALQNWLMDRGAVALTMAACCNYAAFNMADIVGSQSAAAALTITRDYTSAMYVSLGLAVIALVIGFMGLRIDRSKDDRLKEVETAESLQAPDLSTK
ncbi:MAG: MFS transporter, partial [Microbacteriaceae bacterium]|nr:MFS transporter [Microbacteriaceae bacterium]